MERIFYSFFRPRRSPNGILLPCILATDSTPRYIVGNIGNSSQCIFVFEFNHTRRKCSMTFDFTWIYITLVWSLRSRIRPPQWPLTDSHFVVIPYSFKSIQKTPIQNSPWWNHEKTPKFLHSFDFPDPNFPWNLRYFILLLDINDREFFISGTTTKASNSGRFSSIMICMNAEFHHCKPLKSVWIIFVFQIKSADTVVLLSVYFPRRERRDQRPDSTRMYRRTRLDHYNYRSGFSTL